MPDRPKEPVLILLTSHWLTMMGVALVTLAGFSWLFVLPANLRGQIANPYSALSSARFRRVQVPPALE